MQLKPSYKGIWAIAYPIMISSLAQNIINLTDTIFLGRVGQTELAAIGLVGIFFYSFVMIGLGFSKGAQIIIARRAGEKNFRGIAHIFWNVLYFQLSIAIVIFLLLYFYGDFILGFFINSKAILNAGATYLDYRNFSLFFSFTGFALMSFYTGIGKTKPIIYSTVILALLNICLNYVFVFGKMGFSPMGIAGAGLASSIAEAGASIFLLVFTFFSNIQKQFQLFKNHLLSLKLIKSIIKLSIPIVTQFLFGIGSWFLFFSCIEKLGEQELAISNIIKTLYLFFMVPTTGLGSAGQTIISNLLGQQGQNMVWPTTVKILWLSIICTSISCAAILIFPTSFLSIITNDVSLIAASKPLLYLLTSILMLYSISSGIYYTVIGVGAIRASLKIQIAAVFGYLLFTYFVVFILKGGLLMAWLAEFVYWVIILKWSAYYIRSNKWVQLKF